MLLPHSSPSPLIHLHLHLTLGRQPAWWTSESPAAVRSGRHRLPSPQHTHSPFSHFGRLQLGSFLLQHHGNCRLQIYSPSSSFTSQTCFDSDLLGCRAERSDCLQGDLTLTRRCGDTESANENDGAVKVLLLLLLVVGEFQQMSDIPPGCVGLLRTQSVKCDKKLIHWDVVKHHRYTILTQIHSKTFGYTGRMCISAINVPLNDF